MPDIKIQLVFGQAAHTDMRVTPQPGKAEGDHRDTIFEKRVDEDARVETLKAAFEAYNQKAIEAGKDLYAILEAEGLKDEFLMAAGAATGEDVSDSLFAAPLVRIYPND